MLPKPPYWKQVDGCDSLAKRILKDLDSIFCKDPFITEIEVIPLKECIQNKCPVIHVAHQIAIESWCIKHVYQYAYQKLMEWRTRPHKIEPSILLCWTRAILIINPDIQIAWNVRRELVDSQKQEIKDELQFSSIILSRKPKCSEVFVHRRWLLERLLVNTGWSGLTADLLDVELQLCQKAASSYKQNYYAWSHRIWVVHRAAVSPRKLVLQELERTEEWVQSHISDHSGFQFRQFLFSWWRKQSGLPIQFISQNNPPIAIENSSSYPIEISCCLRKEITANSELIIFYGSHEALWYHRRFILHMLFSLTALETSTLSVENASLPQKVKRNKLDASSDKSIWEYEAKFLQDCTENDQNDPTQLLMVERHREWVQKVLAVSLPILH